MQTRLLSVQNFFKNRRNIYFAAGPEKTEAPQAKPKKKTTPEEDARNTLRTMAEKYKNEPNVADLLKESRNADVRKQADAQDIAQKLYTALNDLGAFKVEEGKKTNFIKEYQKGVMEKGGLKATDTSDISEDKPAQTLDTAAQNNVEYSQLTTQRNSLGSFLATAENIADKADKNYQDATNLLKAKEDRLSLAKSFLEAAQLNGPEAQKISLKTKVTTLQQEYDVAKEAMDKAKTAKDNAQKQVENLTTQLKTVDDKLSSVKRALGIPQEQAAAAVPGDSSFVAAPSNDAEKNDVPVE